MKDSIKGIVAFPQNVFKNVEVKATTVGITEDAQQTFIFLMKLLYNSKPMYGKDCIAFHRAIIFSRTFLL